MRGRTLIPRSNRLPLNAKQKRFVAEYLIDLNATQAAIRAGYKAENADVTGPRLLGNVGVAAAVAEGQERLFGKLEITAEKVMRDIEEVRQHAVNTEEWAPALRASELQGKHIGMFVERRETTITERYVVSTPPPEKDADEWAGKHGPH